MKASTENLSPKNRITIGYGREKPMDIVKSRLLLSLLILVFYTFLSLFNAGCPIKYFTGISSPGCGMTRAVLAALRLDFKAAFYYHPLFLLTPFMYFLFLFDFLFPPRIYKITWIMIIVIFLITYFYRLIVTKSDIVNIDIMSGIVLKLIQ